MKTRVPKIQPKLGFSGSGSNPGSIPTSAPNGLKAITANQDNYMGWLLIVSMPTNIENNSDVK